MSDFTFSSISGFSERSSASGRVMMKVLPLPESLTQSIRPPHLIEHALHDGKPQPCTGIGGTGVTHFL